MKNHDQNGEEALRTYTFPDVEALPEISELPDPFLRADGTRVSDPKM